MAFVPDFRIGDVLFDGERSVGMTEDLISETQVVSEDTLVAIQLVYAGDPVGTLQLQYSLDNTNWCTREEEDVLGSSSIIWDITATAVPFFRVKYIYSGSSGILNIKMIVK